jgi:hypothetical protein
LCPCRTSKSQLRFSHRPMSDFVARQFTSGMDHGSWIMVRLEALTAPSATHFRLMMEKAEIHQIRLVFDAVFSTVRSLSSADPRCLLSCKSLRMKRHRLSQEYSPSHTAGPKRQCIKTEGNVCRSQAGTITRPWEICSSSPRLASRPSP